MSLDLRDKRKREREVPLDYPDDEGLFGGRSWTAIGAVVVIGVVVALGIWLAVTADDDEPAPAAQSSTSVAPAAATPTTAGTAAAAECPELATSTEIPTAPPKADWQIVYTAALPFSLTAGPAVIVGDTARCFARSPEGALFAAVQITTRYFLARDGETVAREQTVPGPGQEALLTALKQRGWSPARPGEVCQLAGFDFASYAPERAVISFATRCGKSLQLTQTTVAWSGTDWRVELQPDGSESPTSSVLPDLRGMTPWAGV